MGSKEKEQYGKHFLILNNITEVCFLNESKYQHIN